MMIVVDCKAHIDDIGLVCDIEHNIRLAKFTAADALKVWVGENPARMCFRCDFVISDTSTLKQTYSGFPRCLGSLLGLASECYSAISNL